MRLAFAILVLILLFTQIDFLSTLDTLTHFDEKLVAPLLITYFLSVYVAAYQMSFGLAPLGMQFGTLKLTKINFIAIFYSLVLPGDLAGGVAAWYKLSRPDKKGVEAGTLLIYFRLLNLITLLGIGLVGVWFDTRLSSSIFRVVVGAMFMGIVLVSLPFFSPAVTRWIERFGHSLSYPPSPLLSSKLHTVRKSLTAFQSFPPRTVVSIIGLSLLYHMLAILNFYLLGLAVGIHQSIFLMGWLRSLLVIIQMIPISVAGLGVREASVVFVLHNYGIPDAQALGLSLAVVGMMAVGGAIGGMLEAWGLLRNRHQIDHPVLGSEVEVTTRGSPQSMHTLNDKDEEQ